MTNRFATFMGAVALAAQILVSYGCSSGGGAAGMGGAGGAGTGAGGTVGGAGGAAMVAQYPTACLNVKNKALCDLDGVPNTADDIKCWNTCGPNKSGYKNCDCAASAWACPVCSYDPAKDYSCYKITADVQLCPPDLTDTVNHLPASGGPCTQAQCKPCGSNASTAYRDSTGSPKVGYCVCIPNPDPTLDGVYSCASLLEWAPQ